MPWIPRPNLTRRQRVALHVVLVVLVAGTILAWVPTMRLEQRESRWQNYVGIAAQIGEYSRTRQEGTFQVSQEFTSMAVLIDGGMTPHFAVGESITVWLESPQGRMYGPWTLEAAETHSPYDENGDRGCRASNCGSVEEAVLVKPALGTYKVVAVPRSGQDSMPPGASLQIGVYGYTKSGFINSPLLHGDRIWWYYPDGSSKFVEHGAFIHPVEVTRSAILPTILTLFTAPATIILALVLLRRPVP